jgi:sterol desaturase/sphingolipid hydroxylase (fatty acid hydroxylase superfamily)
MCGLCAEMRICIANNLKLQRWERFSTLCFFTTHCSLRLIVRSELDVPTFATRRFHACHHARAPSGGRWNCGREMSGNFT